MGRVRSVSAVHPRRWFGPRDFLRQLVWHPNIQLFWNPIFYKWFQTVLWFIPSSWPIECMLTCRSTWMISTILSVSTTIDDWPASAGCIFDIHYTRTKSIELTLCRANCYSIGPINFTHFFSCLRCIFIFQVVKT